MSFKIKNLGVLTYDGRWTNHHYRGEPGDDVFAKGFFNLGHERFNEGDLITATLDGPKNVFLTVMKSELNNVVVKRAGMEHQFSSAENPQTVKIDVDLAPATKTKTKKKST